MPQNYKVFIEERPLLISADTEYIPLEFRGLPITVSPDTPDWEGIYQALKQAEAEGWVVIAKPEDGLSAFASLFDLAEAAGGLVVNPKEEYLFIQRNGRWDLPKGKLEKGESIRKAAVREVEEECGIFHLNIEEPLPVTYHTYERNGKRYFKPTYWFLMRIDSAQSGQGQSEEGIETVEWIAASELDQVASLSYPNIRELIKAVVNRPKP